jgi:hypothetical protein
MHSRYLLNMLTALVVLFGLNVVVVEQAQAKRKLCTKVAHQFTPTDKILFVEYGRAAKQSWACNRARRQCNRKLERMRRQGKVGRARCE